MKKAILSIVVVCCIISFGGVAVGGQYWSSKRKNAHNRYLAEKLAKFKKYRRAKRAHFRLSPVEALGKRLFEDENLSLNRNQACNSCHLKANKFADPDSIVAPVFRPVSQGSDLALFGTRNAPPAAYSAFSPKLYWDEEEELFIGGVFWDGRASGQPTAATTQGPELGRTVGTDDPLADQAKGPFLNPVEMALSSLEDVVYYVLDDAGYRRLFWKIYGSQIRNPDGSIDIETAYNKVAEAIAAFERSYELNRFSSRFDKFVKEQGGDVSNFGVVVDDSIGPGFRKYVGPPKGFKSRVLSYEEADGLALFNADSEIQLGVGTGANVGGMCYLCHITERHDPDYGENSTQKPNPYTEDGTYLPLLTDFSYDNLGIPENPRIEALSGPQNPDLGLGGFEREPELSALNPELDIAGEQGKFKVSTLRNIAATAPYGHNGFFPDLYSIVHFYNARDVVGGDFDDGVFPDAEVPETVNTDELGNLGLSFDQEVSLVKFMETLTD